MCEVDLRFVSLECFRMMVWEEEECTCGSTPSSVLAGVAVLIRVNAFPDDAPVTGKR